MATAYSAGSAFLDIIPSFAGVQKAIDRKVREMEKQLGEKAGEEFGKSFEKEAGQGVDKALGTTKSKAKKSGSEAGQEYAGSFASQFASAMKRAEKELTKVTISPEVNDAQAIRQFAGLKKTLQQLGETKIGVEMDAGPAMLAVNAIEARLRELRDVEVNLDVRADLGAAIREVEAFRRRIEKDAAFDVEPKIEYARELGLFERAVRTRIEAALKNFPPVEFDADLSPAEEKIQELRRKMIELADKKIGIDIDGSQALIEIEAIRRELASIAQDTSIDLRARADAAGAAAELLELRKIAKLVDGTEVDIKVDLDATGFHAKLLAVRAAMTNAGSTGDQGANAFRAFNGVILSAVALLPTLVPVLGAVTAGLALFGVAGIGAAAGIGVLVAAFSGIGDAVTALGKAQDTAGKDAQAGAKKMRDASQGVEDAQRALSRARSDGAQAVEDANRRVSEAERDGAESVANANRRVAEAEQDGARAVAKAAEEVSDARQNVADVAQDVAERVADAVDRQKNAEADLARAQEEVVRAQEKVNQARQDAVEEMQDLELSLRGGALAERDAILNLADAQSRWDEVRNAPDLSQRARERLLLDLDKAKLQLDKVRESNGDLAEEQAEWARTGVEGSTRVVEAQRGVADAQDGVRQAQERVADASQAVAKAVADGQRAQADAARGLQDAIANQTRVQQDAAATMADALRARTRAEQDAASAVADAVRARSRAEQDAATSTEDAQRNLTRAQEAYSDALFETGTTGSAAMQAVGLAMGALGPAGQRFALFIHGLRDDMRGLRDIAQAGVLPGVEEAISRILGTNGPLLRKFVGDTAVAIGDLFRALGVMFTSAQWQAIFGSLAQYAPIFITQFGQIGMALLTFFGELFRNLAPYAVRFNDILIRIVENMAEWASGLGENEGFKAFMNFLFTEGPGIFSILWDILRAVGNIIIALAPLGGVVLELIGYVARFIAEMDPRVLGSILTVVLGLIASFQVAVGVFSLVMLALDAALLPITATILVIGAVIAVLIALYTQSETFRTIVNGVFAAVGEAIDKWWNYIVKPVFEAFSWAWDQAGKLLDRVWKEIIKPIFDGIATFSWDGFTGGLQTAFGNMAQLVGDGFSALWDFLKPGGTLDTWVSDGLSSLVDQAKTLADPSGEFQQGLLGIWAGAWEDLKPGGTLDTKVSEGLTSLGNKTYEWLKPGGELDQKFIGMWDGINDSLEDVDLSYQLGRLAGDIAEWNAGIIVQIRDSDWFQGVKENLRPGGDLDQSVGRFFSELPGKAYDFFKIGGSLDRWAEEFLRSMNQGFDNGLAAVGRFFTNLPGNIYDFLKMGGGMDQAAQWIIDGLINGLTTGWTDLAAWVDEKWESFKQGFRDAMGIESPSKVFHQFGLDILNGLLNGINELYLMVVQRWTDFKNDSIRTFGELQASVVSSATTLRDDVTTRAQETWNNGVFRFGAFRDGASVIFQELKDRAVARLTEARDDLTTRAQETWDNGVFRFGAFRDAASFIFGDLKDKAIARLTEARDTLTTRAQETKDNAEFRFGALRDAAGIIFTDLRDRASNLVSNLRDSVVSTAQNIWDQVADKFSRMRDAVHGLFADMVRGARERWADIREATRGPVNFVIGTVLNNGLFRAWDTIVNKLGLNAGWKLQGSISEIPAPSKIGLAAGGQVPGWSPNDVADNIPAMLTAGEHVQPRKRVRQYGVDFLEAIRHGRIDPRAARALMHGQRYAVGGLVEFGRRLQSMGAKVTEHPAFGGVAMGGHGRTSLHYSGNAIDVNTRPGTSALEQRELAPMAALARSLGFRTIFMAPDHYNHLHVDNGGAASIGQKLAGAASAVSTLLGGLWDSVGAVKDSLLAGITGPLGQIAQNPLGDLLKGMVGKLPEEMWNKISGTVSTLMASAAEAASSPFSFNLNGVAGSNKAIVQTLAAQRGWGGGAEWAALDRLIMKESGYNNLAQNPTSTAYGMFQFLNSTWAGYGTKTSDPTRQTVAGLNYIAQRYGSPSKALAFHLGHNWYSEGGEVTPATTQGEAPPTLYDSGGWVPPGISTVVNATNRPEPLMTGQAWDELIDAAGGGGAAPSQVIGALHLYEVQSDLEEAVGTVNHWANVYSNQGRYTPRSDR